MRKLKRSDDTGAKSDLPRQESVGQERIPSAPQFNEEHLRTLVENARDLVYRIRLVPSFAVEYVNSAANGVLGRSLEEFSNAPDLASAILYPDDRPTIVGLLQSPEVRDCQVRLRLTGKDGRVIWTEHQMILVRDWSGRLVAIEGIARDITDHYHTDEARHFLDDASKVLASSLDYETTLQRVADLAVPRVADRCSVHVLEGSSLRRVAVATTDLAREQKVAELTDRYPATPEIASTNWQAVETGQSYLSPQDQDLFLAVRAVDSEHRRLLEELGPYSVMVVPLLARERKLGALRFTRFGTERSYDTRDLALAEELGRRAAQAIDNARLYREVQDALTRMEKMEQRSALLADASSILSSTLDYETALHDLGRLIVARFADCCIIDMAAEDSQLLRFAVTWADGTKEPIVSELQHRLRPTRGAKSGPARIMRTGRAELIPDPSVGDIQDLCCGPEHHGVLCNLKVSSAMIVPLEARGQIVGAITLLSSSNSGRTFSEADLRLAEEIARRAALAIDNARLYLASQRAVRLRNDFLSVAAHELKTPITSLRGFAQLFLRQTAKGQALDPNGLHQAFEVIDKQSRKLSSLVSQLLDVSRIEAGRLPLERELVDVTSLVEDMVSNAQATTDRHEIVVSAPPQLLLRVDALRFEQVMTNLIDNAIKYSPDGGPIEVSLSKIKGGIVRFAVRDHGIGIPFEHRPYIFERFYQAHAGRHYGGMGLGLYISKQIVGLHGGRIAAEFPPDGGTSFVVSLPIDLHHPRSTGV